MEGLNSSRYRYQTVDLVDMYVYIYIYMSIYNMSIYISIMLIYFNIGHRYQILDIEYSAIIEC